MQGEDNDVAESLGRGEVESAQLDEAHRVLLEFVELLTRHSHRTTAEDVERLRSAGWSEEQIAEAVYITALFAFYNRVADAFGLQDPGYVELSQQGKMPSLPSQKSEGEMG